MGEQEPQDMRRLITIVLVVTGLAGGVDLVMDRPTHWLSSHVLFEVALMTWALGSAIWLARGWRGAEVANRRLQESLEARKAERDAWRANAEQALAGLGAAIDAQFTAWGLTPSEREVALLVLQGHGHKEIAVRTNRSERTVRQHAAAAYQKAGLGGRAELAAFFLEGVALPKASSPTP